MDILQYIYKYKLSIRKFAKLVKISYPTIHRYIHGTVPSLRLARQMEDRTRGELKAHELRKAKNEIHRISS
jgi:hypothetical protein